MSTSQRAKTNQSRRGSIANEPERLATGHEHRLITKLAEELGRWIGKHLAEIHKSKHSTH